VNGNGHGATTWRLPPQPGEVIDRARELSFTWNGREYPAYEGDTIVSALAAALTAEAPVRGPREP